ncbi:RdgB/HAM1 family non-canonical purine NTP pyrophosphatase [Paraferrimonas sp. SM1919]|uniref:RdgB/HAM1 family non-canonical purine NTP pyrophosphatase n=1 Tax=Paraferrimonas sp. SM1919 TaxID=2662263 RepID=UPI0013D51B0B|nr:RdgB/HAM1 family non-canonical purine NTP pyrophosphatase [Paraferrimonas sp. SM1919]
MTKNIVLASGNKGKLAEFTQMFQDLAVTIKPQSEFNVSEVAETGTTFVENAIIKARHAAEISGLPAISDDSGIEADGLNGAPGVYSARYGGEGATAQDNYTKLLKELGDNPNRKARFQCVLVYMRHHQDASPVICQASWEGTISDAPHGNGGHGYDPIFVCNEHAKSAAELTPEQKNAISHRGKALEMLLAKLKQLGEL